MISPILDDFFTFEPCAMRLATARDCNPDAAPTDVQAQQAPARRPVPGQVVQLGAPTTRPNEPITAGANFGPGMNAAQAGIPMMLTNDQRAIEELRAIYELFPTEDLGDLLNAYSEDLG